MTFHVDTNPAAEDAAVSTLSLDVALLANAAIDVDDLLNAEEAANAAVPVTIDPFEQGATIVSARIGDTDLTMTEDDGIYTFDATDLAEGEHTITVVTKDVAGNETITTRTVIIDRLVPDAPTVVLETDSGADGDLITNDASLAISDIENGATIEYRIDEGDWSAAYDPESLGDGPHTVQVRARDIAGNVSEASAITFTLDTTAPDAPGVVLATDSGADDDDGITNDGALTVTAENGATVEYSVNGGEWSATYDPESLDDGDYTVQVRVTDAAGNVSEASEITFSLDRTIQDAGIEVDDHLNDAEAVAAVPVTITPDDGATIVSAQIGDTDLIATEEAGVYTFDASGLEDGEYTITVVTRDIAGNQTITTRTVTIDRLVPDAPILAVIEAGPGFSVNAGAVVIVTVNGEAVADLLTLFDKTTSDGRDVYSAKANAFDGSEDIDVSATLTDGAGNTSAASILENLTFDTTAPADAGIEVDDHLNGEEAVAAVPVIITPDAGTTIVTVQIGDTDLTATEEAGVYTFDATDLADGEHTITVVTADNAGNQRTTTRTIVIDTHAPTGVTLSNGEVSEAAEIGDLVGTLMAVDESPNGTYTFAIVDENGDPVEDSLFEIVQNGDGEYQVRVKAALDHEEEGEHTIRVRVSDGFNAPHIQEITIAIANEDDNEPTGISIPFTQGLVAENAQIGTVLVSFQTIDADGGDPSDYTYTFIDPIDQTETTHDLFELDGNKLKVKTELNDAQVGLHEFLVKVTDSAGHSYVKSITVGVYNIQEAPENVTLTLSDQPLRELAGNGTEIGTLSADDQDIGDHVAFRLVDDAGGRFDIVNGKIVVKNGLKLDYEQARSHKVVVEAKDDSGLVTLKTFTINLTNWVGETAVGTAAKDTFFGGAGKDVFNGGAGNDTLGGGLGNDVLTGGSGKDVFVFNTKLNKSSNVDTIKGFSVKDDTIRLENAIFKKLSKTGTLKKDFFTIGTKAKDKNDFIIYDNKKGCLYYDADGSGKGAAILFAKLDKGLKMTAADFFVI